MSIPTKVQVACAFYKFAQGCNPLICCELFVMGRLTISLILKKIITTFNVVFKKIITWTSGIEMEMVMQDSLWFPKHQGGY